MKSIKEWFNELPDDIREKAFKNTKAHAKYNKEKKYDTLSYEQVLSLQSNTLNDALLGAFVFSITPEGQDYWWKIINEANNVTEQDNPEPDWDNMAKYHNIEDNGPENYPGP